MEPIYFFSMVMVLFWILVQQICLCCIKWAYEDILGNSGVVKWFVAANVALFFCCVLFAFDSRLAVALVYESLPTGVRHIYDRLRWNFFCSVMLILDGLLIMYGFRIYKLYMSQVPAVRPRLAVGIGDFVAGGIFLVFFGVYHYGMASVAMSHRLSEVDLYAIQFFYIKIANFFYAFFEGTLAVLLWRVYRRIKSSEVVA